MLGIAKTLGVAALGAAAALAVQDDELGYQDTPIIPNTDWHVHDGLRPQPPVVTPGDSAATAPSDATVLFDGSSLDAWEGGPWDVAGGAMTVNGKGGIKTKEEFGSCQLHLEWKAPTYGEGEDPHGQHRGNSGVFFFERYEIQILDCFENQTYPDGMTAALYGQMPPSANACRPAGEWQTYDILFEAPRFGDDGRLVRPALATVFHNGVCVHHAQPLLGATKHRAVASYATHGPEGKIAIQDHGNPISFRNVWVRPLTVAE